MQPYVLGSRGTLECLPAHYNGAGRQSKSARLAVQLCHARLCSSVGLLLGPLQTICITNPMSLS